MINEIKVTVAGNVTRKPEAKNRKVDGRPFTVVAIAANSRRFDSGSGQWVEVGTTFYDIICRNGMGANALASLDVGMPVIAYGKFRVDEWESGTTRGARPTLVADSIGVDLTWGTTTYTRGSKSYPQENDGYVAGPPPASEGGPAYQEDGITVDANGEVLHAPGDGHAGEDDVADDLPDELADDLVDELGELETSTA